MKKRITKSQREAAAKAALRQRVFDIYSGAQGAKWDEECFATAEVLSRVIPVLEKVFDTEEWVFQAWNLGYFNGVDSATEFLFRNGVRA